jgi:hypothetical protein
MRQFDILIAIGVLLCAMPASQAQQNNELERVQAASRKFVAAVSGRDINAIDTVWGTRELCLVHWPVEHKRCWSAGTVFAKAWQMRFHQGAPIKRATV